jgi:hypothetical protein
MEVIWSEFKKFVDNRKCSIQYVEVKKNYWMKAISGSFEIECFIPIDPTNEDTSVFLDLYLEYSNKLTVPKNSSFTSKTTDDGNKIYKREHGIQYDLTVGENTILYTIPYPWVKVTGLDVMNGEVLDIIDVLVLDSIEGSYSSIPNYVLNQFGFNVNLSQGMYSCQSTFDADLFIGMQIKVVYNSQTAKKIGLNFSLNEVK